MPQKYKIATMLGNAGKDKTCRLYIRVMTTADDIRLPTSIKLKKTNFKNGKIVGVSDAHKLNLILAKERMNIEAKITEAILRDRKIDKSVFLSNAGMAGDFVDFVEKHIELNTGKFSAGRIKHLKSNLNILLGFDEKISFEKINKEYIQRYEKYLRETRKDSTVLSKIKALMSFLNAASHVDLFDKKQIYGYKNPKWSGDIPVYLNEKEIDLFKKVVQNLGNKKKQNAGYYFLLSCFAGYRISDCAVFNYAKKVKDGVIVVRAKKNKEIVSIPVYPKLAEILDYCKKSKFENSEQDAREFVKEIAKDAGLKNWKDIKFHSGRHTFAMYCLSKGLSKDEVAELLGDSRQVVDVYARIINTQLHKSVLEKLG